MGQKELDDEETEATKEYTLTSGAVMSVSLVDKHLTEATKDHALVNNQAISVSLVETEDLALQPCSKETGANIWKQWLANAERKRTA